MPITENSNSKLVPAIRAEHTAGGSAVYAKSNDGRAVEGWSTKNYGVTGDSTLFPGVRGTSLSGRGVEGWSTKDDGVWGISTDATGVHGISKGGGAGVVGESQSGEGVHGQTISLNVAAVAGISLNVEAVGSTGVYGETKGGGAGVFGTSQNGEGVHGQTTSPIFAAVAGVNLDLTPTGTGAGVYGEHRGNGPAGFFKGNVVVTGNLTANGDIFLPGADFAEDFDIEDKAAGTPGTVMVIAETGRLEPSRSAYDKRVAGVISGAGAFKPGIILDKVQSNGSRAPLALLGKVYCKVDAAHGPITVGDMLTTSPTLGHAMKVCDPKMASGSMIGKALSSMLSGQGLIPILIALQ